VSQDLLHQYRKKILPLPSQSVLKKNASAAPKPSLNSIIIKVLKAQLLSFGKHVLSLLYSLVNHACYSARSAVASMVD